jgi:hypothetical protein
MDSLLEPTQPVIATAATDSESTATALQVAELKAQLRRERSRRRGLENGIEALSERLAELQRENAELRARLK